MKRTITILSLALALTVAAFAQGAPAQQPKPEHLSKQQLNTLIADAKTPAEHQRIAQYFDAEAAKYAAEAKEHEGLAQAYLKSGPASAKYPGGMQTFSHCESMSKSLQKAAENARQLASDHQQMAKNAEQK
jgi:hypothetical protein